MEDNKIIKLYWQRNQRAIIETDKKYGAYCAQIARNILNNEEDTKECLNDTYLNVWNSIPPQKPKVLSSFLGKIIRNISINRYNKDKTGKRGNGEKPLILEELSEIVSGKDNTEAYVESKELISAINAFLHSLPSTKRNIFICRYFYGDSIKALSKEYKMAEAAVSMLLLRQRTKLQAYLLERGYEI